MASQPSMITRVVLLLAAWMVAGPACADRLLLQVEDFEGPWRRQTNVGGFLGQGFCTSNAKGKIATTAMRGKALIREPGRYAVWLRAYTSDNSRRGLQMEVADKRLGVTHKDTRNRWGWEKAGEATVPLYAYDPLR